MKPEHRAGWQLPKKIKLYLKCIVGGLSVVASGLALASSVEITARFSPDPTKPYNNIFTNTTPDVGFCIRQPAYCQANNLHSISLEKFDATGQDFIYAHHPDERQGVMFKVPVQRRVLSVVSPSGARSDLTFKFVGFGASMETTDVRTKTGISSIKAAHNALWAGGALDNAPDNCFSTTPIGGYTAYIYRFFWLSRNGQPCAKQALFDFRRMYIYGISAAYELTTPNPLEMEAGTYTGSLVYTIGPGMDFDFGDVIIPSESTLTINFTLEVNHVLGVRFPPNSDRVALNPEGGWQQWLNRGRRPEKLFANQSFQLWNSGMFKMQIQCQYPVGDMCGIRNGSGHVVPVNTLVTLPPGVTSMTGNAVNRYQLSNSVPSFFYPSRYVDNGRAVLNFEVDRDGVEQMIGYAGERYLGNVTVVWDSEI
uniref:hypothetical protein n=1 Tax=Pseudomonas laurentiana TaxID=2364649 RepID=UPI0029C7BD62|nr:hypothetical protein [Pseudomonas laurentiana]